MTITTPTQKQSQITANKIIGGIAQVEWREMGKDGEPPAIPTLEDLSKKVKSLEWQPPQAFLTALPPEEYPSLPQDPEPPGDAEKAWYRFNRCYLSHAKAYPSNIYQVLENRQNDPLNTEVIDQSEHYDEKTGPDDFCHKIKVKVPTLTTNRKSRGGKGAKYSDRGNGTFSLGKCAG